MYENLRGRVSRILSAGMSSIVNVFEGLSPDGMLEAAIREIDDAGREIRDELDRLLASRHMAQKRLDEKSARLKELEAQIAVAVKEDRDDLAEAGIAQQLDIEAQLPVLKDTVEQQNRKEGELHSFIAALEAKKREMREEMNRLKIAKAGASAALPAENLEPAAGLSGAVGQAQRKVSQAASAFERILSRESGLPQDSAAPLTDQAKLAELEKLSRDNRIKERLAALKAAKGD